MLLDTDVGTDVDDAIAIALLLAAPEVDLRAITTVSGDTRRRGHIAKKLLALARRADVPVAAGIREPILRQRTFLWLGHEGRGIVHDDEHPPLAPAHGVDLLIDVVLRERPHVVAIGPLSNLAVAIMKEPAVAEAIPRLTVMGGSFSRVPDVPATIEYNFGSDAEAALVTLTAGIPTTLVPLDVTSRVALTVTDLRRLRQSGSAIVQTLCDAIEVWAPIQRQFFAGVPGLDDDIVAFLHDPLTVATLFEPSLVTIERRPLRPAIIDGGFHLLDEPGAPVLDVAVAVDARRCVELVTDRLLSL